MDLKANMVIFRPYLNLVNTTGLAEKLDEEMPSSIL
jgi:hypothetical protein